MGEQEPSISTWVAGLTTLNPWVPVISTPPTVWAAMRIGASAVPCRFTLIEALVVYTPLWTTITSPGSAAEMRARRSSSDRTS